MTDISICCLLHNSEWTRAGHLTEFFKHIDVIERASKLNVEKISQVDDRTTDKTNLIAQCYSDTNTFKFSDYSQAKNELLRMAKGDWILMVEPTMRYKLDNVVNLMRRALRSDYKCIEAWQRIIEPDRQLPNNLYCLLIKNDQRFEGLAFETLRIFPHENDRVPVLIGRNYMEPQALRLQNAKSLYEKELEQLAALKTDDPKELYWAAKRYGELDLMECIEKKWADQAIVGLLEKAIELKPDFGPAYFELAVQHFYMKRKELAFETARKCFDYKLCRAFCEEVEED